jgi:hypothetical protein
MILHMFAHLGMIVTVFVDHCDQHILGSKVRVKLSQMRFWWLFHVRTTSTVCTYSSAHVLEPARNLFGTDFIVGTCTMDLIVTAPTTYEQLHRTNSHPVPREDNMLDQWSWDSRDEYMSLYITSIVIFLLHTPIDSEHVSSSRVDHPEFQMCCTHNKIKVPLLRNSPPYLWLIQGDTPSHDAKEFRANFAFTSLDVKVDQSIPGQGPPVFQIHGELKHLSGFLFPDESVPPSYSLMS